VGREIIDAKCRLLRIAGAEGNAEEVRLIACFYLLKDENFQVSSTVASLLRSADERLKGFVYWGEVTLSTRTDQFLRILKLHADKVKRIKEGNAP